MNKKLLAVLALAASGVILSAAPLNAQNGSARPMPGYWRFSTTAVGLFRDSDEHCLSQAEVDRFYNNPCKRNSVCVYTTKVMQPDGTVNFDGVWTDRKNRVTKVRANGRLLPTQMTLSGTATYGLRIPFNFTATRISATCP
ncbi:MAG: DUF3617 family protein [Pseudomonadota bacterium]